MIVADVKIEVRKTEPSASPKRDALQVLPGSGTVRVTVTTEDGVVGEGSAGFGRIAGGPDALAAQIEHELKPLVVGSDVGRVRATHQAMLRETEYHGAFGLAMFGIAAMDTALWDALGRTVGVAVLANVGSL